jgi:DNA-binding GntR family transcriptional regulator
MDRTTEETFSTIHLKTYKDAIYEYIRQSIVDQRIKPSDRIQEKDLARQFGVSITPVREAIRKLEGEGYLEVHAHRGVTAKSISDVELIEIYKVLRVLDSYAASLAIPNMTREHILELIRLTDQMESYGHEGRIAEYLQVNARVHKFIWDLAGNSFLSLVLKQIQSKMLQYPQERIDVYSQPSILKKSMISHRKIVAAIEAGKPKQVEKICRDHWILFAQIPQRKHSIDETNRL